MLKCFNAFLYKLRFKKNNSWYSNINFITFGDYVRNLQTMSYVFISRKLTNLDWYSRRGIFYADITESLLYVLSNELLKNVIIYLKYILK